MIEIIFGIIIKITLNNAKIEEEYFQYEDDFSNSNFKITRFCYAWVDIG